MRALMTALFCLLAVAPMTISCQNSGAAAAAAQQTMPLTITQAGKTHRFTVEVARTEEEQRQGLMFRTSLPANGGMLFPFAKPKIASFWMENTLIPLDMIFIRADGTIDRIAENTVPHSREPIASGSEVTAVLELAGGTAARLGIDETATVDWQH